MPRATCHDAAPELPYGDRAEMLVRHCSVEVLFEDSFEPLPGQRADLVEVRDQVRLARPVLALTTFDGYAERIPLRKIEEFVANPVVLDFRDVPKQPGHRIRRIRWLPAELTLREPLDATQERRRSEF